MGLEFIYNQNKNHATHLSELFFNADEIWIAVAFLKTSGLNSLLQSIKKHIEAGKKISIIAGQNFALTEPKALSTLFQLFENKNNAKAYLANAKKKTEIFHPKLYIFKKAGKATIISGSANMTNGGLETNIECSIKIEVNVNEQAFKDAYNFITKLLSSEYSEPLSRMSLKRYETFFEKQKNYNKQAKAIPERSLEQHNFNYKNLVEHFKKFNSSERGQLYKEKKEHYAKAKKVLDAIADNPKLTQPVFESLLDSLVGSKDVKSLFHSGSLFRLRKFIYPHYKEFQKLVKYIKEHSNEDASTLFHYAKMGVAQIEGAGINYLTEIMMTYNPVSFANMNNNPLTVLRKAGGLNIKASSTSYSGEDYADYCLLIKEISTELGLKDMLEADSFFNDIYWKIYKKK